MSPDLVDALIYHFSKRTVETYSRDPWLTVVAMEDREQKRPRGGRRMRARFLKHVLLVTAAILAIIYLLPTPTVHSGAYAVPPWIRTVQTKEQLLDSLSIQRYHLQNISEGTIFGVDNGLEWRRPYAFADHMNVVEDTSRGSEDTKVLPQGVPESILRPKVFTYFEQDPRDETSEDTDQRQILEVWKRAMWAGGFEPVVYGINDTMNHPKYQDFADDEQLKKTYREENKKWFGWALNGGGILMDYTVIPVVRQLGSDNDLLRIITAYKDGYPRWYNPIGRALVSSGPEYVERLLRSIIEGDEEESFRDFFDVYQDTDDVFAHYTADFVATMSGGERKTAKQIASLMNTHLHHAFLKQFLNNGVAIVDPLQDSADILTIPATTIAKSLVQCPVDELSNVCPPTIRHVVNARDFIKKNLAFLQLSGSFCNNPCAEEKQHTKKSQTVIPIRDFASLPEVEAGYFSIVGIPHPLTVLSMMEGDPAVTALVARKDLQRNAFLRQLASTYIPGNTVGTSYRLMLIKDAIYQVPAVTNSIWFNWEYLADRDKKAFMELVEWDVGFTLPGKQESTLAVAASVDDAIKGSDAIRVAHILHSSQTRVLDISGKDKDKAAIEAWNMADTEIWKFLAAWRKEKVAILKSQLLV
jgi:hypothetical protein